MSNNPLIGTAEAARVLGVSTNTVHRLVAAGTLTATKLGGKTGAFVLAAEQVHELKAQREHPPVAASAVIPR